MKNITKKLVMLGVTLFLLTVGMRSNAEAQCPTGYTAKTINMNVGGCIYTFDICYKCSPLGMGATKVEFLSGPTLIPTTPACSSSVPLSGVMNYIMAQVQSPAFIFNELCTYKPPAPPCDGPNPPELVTYKIPQCWEAEVIMYFGEKAVTFRQCSDDICEVTYSICVDGQGGYVRTEISKTGGTPSCTIEASSVLFPDPSNLDPYPVGHKTDCYIYHSVCNP
jgi:hypothetical protein